MKRNWPVCQERKERQRGKDGEWGICFGQRGRERMGRTVRMKKFRYNGPIKRVCSTNWQLKLIQNPCIWLFFKKSGQQKARLLIQTYCCTDIKNCLPNLKTMNNGIISITLGDMRASKQIIPKTDFNRVIL